MRGRLPLEPLRVKPAAANTKAALARLGYAIPKPDIKPFLIMGLDGKPKSGKSRFAFTMPAPIAYINFDRSIKYLLDQFKGKDIMLKDFTREMPTDGQWDPKKAGRVWDEFVKIFMATLDTGVRSLVVDTASEIWEVLRWAKFGKLDHVKPHHYTQVNGPYRQLLNEAQHHNTNVLLLHKAKEVWEEDKQGNPHPTGEWVRDGFRGTSFALEVDGFMWRDPGGGSFHLEVRECGPESVVAGQVFSDEEITFPEVASLVLPSVDPKEWR
jgi:hypothetical protein